MPSTTVRESGHLAAHRVVLPSPPRARDRLDGRAGATAMTLSPATAIHLQSAAGNRAVAQRLASSASPSTQSAPVIQRTWQYVYDFDRLDAQNDTYYWDPGPTGQAEPTLAPGAARRFRLVRGHLGDPLNGRQVMGEAQYLFTRAGGTTGRGKGSTYNPFGRFSTQLTQTAYVPRGTPPDQLGNLGVTQNPGLGRLVAEHATIAGVDWDEPVFLDGHVYPRRVQVGVGTWLDMVAMDPLGVTYGDGPPLATTSSAQRGGQARDVPQLKAVAAELARHGATRAVVAEIDAGTIQAFSGSRSSEDSQQTVMGVSAGDMAAAAGYDGAIDPEFAADQTTLGKRKHGWEWLHLISYALGGPEAIGPQHAANLIVGTTAANTAMIMIEDAINNAIIDPAIPVKAAKLVVKPIMAEPAYLIAETITYQVSFLLTNGRVLPELTLGFSALSTATPYEATNKYFRTLLKALLDAEAATKPFGRSSMYG